MRVLGYPLFHFDGKPERVDTEGDDGEQKPFDVVAEELTACAIKAEFSAVDDGVTGNPSLFDAYCPGECDAESDDGEEDLQEADANQA